MCLRKLTAFNKRDCNPFPGMPITSGTCALTESRAPCMLEPVVSSGMHNLH